MSEYLISTGIDVGPNEYLTKFLFNRNFKNLISNDFYLYNKVKTDNLRFYSYNSNKSYKKDDLVFYKTSEDSLNLYLLCSLIEDNISQPSSVVNSISNKIIVGDDNWAIVGIPEAANKHSTTDIADEYILSSKINLYNTHESNLNISAHPLGLFGKNQSSILESNLENIDENRDTFFYPYKIKKLLADDTIQNGYMRKWDNGLVEYDITFRLAYSGKSDDGDDLLSANSISIKPRNYNYLYFKDKKDYNIFSQGGNYQAIINGQKQVNLNKTINSYSGNIVFPESFKDLNYMIFTSGVKNITTRTYNTNNEVIEKYDERLIINGTTITGHQIDTTSEDYHSLYKNQVNIPDQVKTIADDSMQNIKWGRESEGLQNTVVIFISQDSQLINICDQAFSGTNIAEILFPKSLRRIGTKAFSQCSILETLNFYIYKDISLQPKIEKNAFVGTNIKYVNIYYISNTLKTTLFGTSSNEEIPEEERRLSAYSDEISLADKFRDPLIRKYQFGITNDITITENYDSDITTPLLFASSTDNFDYSKFCTPINTNNNDVIVKNENNEEEVEDNTYFSDDMVIGINVKDFLNELNNKKQILSSTPLLASSNIIFGATTKVNALSILSTYFQLEGYEDQTSSIIGVKDTLPDNFDLNFNSFSNDTTINNLTAIRSSALKNCLKLSSVVITKPIRIVEDEAFYGCSNIDRLIISSNIVGIGKNAFTNCGNIEYCALSCPDLQTKYLYSEDSFSGNTYFNNVEILTNPLLSCFSSRPYIVLSTNNFNIDIKSGFISEAALSTSIIKNFKIKNIASGKKITINKGTTSERILTGFAPNAFLSCYTKSIFITDNQMSYVSNILISKLEDEDDNYLNISCNTTIVNNIEKTYNIVQGDGDIDNIPYNYLIINQLSVSAIVANSIPTSGIIDIINPIEAILDNGFKVINNNNKIRQINLPSTLTYIGNNAFNNNQGLSNINIPKDLKLTYIGKDAFLNCKLLSNLYFDKSSI